MTTNNKLSCDVIQDLLPLYEDQCCSEATKILVEEHLGECASCQKAFGGIHTNLPTSTETPPNPEVKKIKKGIRSMKQIRAIGIAALSLCLAIIFIIIPLVNYHLGHGITYTNLDDLHTAMQFAKALQAKDYDKAYTYFDIEGHYKSLISTDYGSRDDDNTNAQRKGIEQIAANGLEWYDETAKDKFLSNMDALTSSGSLIESFSFLDIGRTGTDMWYVHLNAQLENGTFVIFDLSVTEGGIYQVDIYVDGMRSIGDLNSQNPEINEYLSHYYDTPTLNETIIEIIYGETDWDWTMLFDHEYDTEEMFSLQ